MLFRRFKPEVSPDRKAALVTNACLALEIHAQLEEEIFYPALRPVVAGDEGVLNKSVPEHDEMRQLIGELRSMEPGDPAFDRQFRALIRTVLHHVADEETTLLPLAEETLGDELRDLGARMTKRRIQLLGPHAGEVAVTAARSFPLATVAAGLGVAALATMLITGGRGRTQHRNRLQPTNRQ
jgi:hypothetical protein